MEEELKCFVCQSKSKSKSADGSSSGKRRKKVNNYTNLDSSAWRTFCHYFYPPPLVGLLESSSSPDSPGVKHQNEEFSRPVFCGACYQTISNLCKLHSQLELIQSQISKIVAQVSVTFVQEKENHGNEGPNNNSNCDGSLSSPAQRKRKKGQERCDDDVIYSMRRRIRQRYQPVVCISGPRVDISNQRSGDFNEFEANESSPLSLPSNDLNIDLDLFRPIKQEAEDSIDFTVDDEECRNQENSKDSEHMNDNSGSPAPGIKTEIQARNKFKRKNEDIMDDSEGEDGCHGSEIQDSDYEPDGDNKLAAKKKVPLSKSKIKSKSQRKVKAKKKSSIDKKHKEKKPPKSRNSPRGPYNKNLLKPTKDPKVGENIYEYGGQWRYEKKLDEDGKVGYYCLSCTKNFPKRYQLTRHIHRMHRDVQGQHHRLRTHKLDDNTYTYDGIYTIHRVTEPNGIFFKCGTCSALKKTIEMLKSHLREVHIDPHKWVCEFCGYSCPSKARLEMHMESHDDVKKYICDVCGKLLKTRREVKSHKESHSTPFMCGLCSRRFIYSKGLRDHERKAHNITEKVIATPEEPFVPKVCKICRKEFVSQEKFQKHVTICEGRVRTPCEWCHGLFYYPKVHQQKVCKERFRFLKESTDCTNANNLSESPFNIEEDRGTNSVEETILS